MFKDHHSKMKFQFLNGLYEMEESSKKTSKVYIDADTNE